MKKIFVIAMSIVSAGMLWSCSPMTEDGPDPETSVTADNFQGTVTQEGTSNRVICSTTSPCTVQWTDGVKNYTGNYADIRLFTTGTQTITVTGMNQDGSTFTKDYSVNVSDMKYAVDPEYGYFCGTGERTWVWDDTSTAGVWGNGGYMENTAPGWWQVSLADITGQAESKGYTGDGANGSMTFTLKGLKLTKSDGTSGTFKFDMTQITKEGWSIGKLYTSGVNVLMGILVNNGNAVVDEYNILTLNDEKLVLCAPEPGAGDWGTGWFWCFKAKN